MLTLSVLGPLEVHRDDQHLTIPAGKTTEVLVRLALDAGTTVSADRLIEDLWGAGSGGTTKNTLQSKVTRLRRVLDESELSSSRAGYALAADVVVDALVIGDRARDARDLLAAGDAAGAERNAREGLSRFRGDLLVDGGDGEWLVPHRTRLEAVRLDLLGTGLRARLGLGDAAGLVADAERAVADHPLDEGLWTVLVTALYRAHRQADALAACRRVRELLAEELGLDPGPELRELERQVLAHDDALAVPVATPSRTPRPTPSAGPDGPAPTAADDPGSPAAAQTVDRTVDQTSSRPGNLPGIVARLVGRADELADLDELLDEHRLVSLVGPAGVGKTRLAVEVGRTRPMPGGTWLARLEHARSRQAVEQAVGDCFGILGATAAMLTDRLRTEEALLVLDNCEHVPEVVADLVSDLLEAAPGLRVLATSQRPLTLEGESVYHLEPLGSAESVELFQLRAVERHRSFDLDPEAARTVAELCRSLDGLPLAIELAAARTRVLSVGEIARRLDDRFRVLSDSTGRRTERHRALSTAIGWSHDLLFPDERRALWALSCFAGGAPLDAAESVAVALGVPEDATLDLFERLADRSLVVVGSPADGAGDEVRYRLLDSVRAFALARLDDEGLTATAFAAHLAWLQRAAARARAGQNGPEQPIHQRCLRHEAANLDAGVGWARDHDPEVGLEVALGFGWTSVTAGEGTAGADRLRSALAAQPDASTDDRALAMAYIAWHETGADVRRAREAGREALELATRGGDVRVLAQASCGFAFSEIHSGDPAAALTTIAGAESLDLTPWERSLAGIITGYAGLIIGDASVVLAACDRADDGLARIPRDDWLASHVESIRGQLAQATGDLETARTYLSAAVDSARRAGNPAVEGFHLASLGRVLQLTGEYDEAVAVISRGIELGTRVGLMRVVALGQVRLGRVQRERGDEAASRAALGAASEWFAASGLGEEALLANCLLAALDQDIVRLRRAVEEADAAEDAEVQVLARDAIAAAAVREGEPERAVTLLKEADALMPAAAHRLAESDRLDARAAREGSDGAR